MPERRSDPESVEWASLEVYGPPEEVPVALHAIWSSDPQRRMLGYEYLSDRLVHQGSRSPASAAAAPFLIDVVADPAAPDRFAACQILRQIAIGEEEYTLNERPDFAQLRRETARKATMTVQELTADLAAWVDAATDSKQRAARERGTSFANVERDRLTERWNIEAYDAVRAGVPVYVAALSADHLGTRIYAAQLMAYFPEDAASVVPALIALIGGADPIVGSAAAVAAGICARGTEDPAAAAAITVRWQRAENLAERWATAIGLAQLLNHPGADILADVEAATEAPAPVPHFPSWTATSRRSPRTPWTASQTGTPYRLAPGRPELPSIVLPATAPRPSCRPPTPEDGRHGGRRAAAAHQPGFPPDSGTGTSQSHGAAAYGQRRRQTGPDGMISGILPLSR